MSKDLVGASDGLIVTTRETGTGELVARFNAEDGVYSFIVEESELVKGMVPVHIREEVGHGEHKNFLIQLPRAAFNGSHFFTVPAAFVDTETLRSIHRDTGQFYCLGSDGVTSAGEFSVTPDEVSGTIEKTDI